jgi:hypothetical protein
VNNNEIAADILNIILGIKCSVENKDVNGNVIGLLTLSISSSVPVRETQDVAFNWATEE